MEDDGKILQMMRGEGRWANIYKVLSLIDPARRSAEALPVAIINTSR
jgi:hypothetical protein